MNGWENKQYAEYYLASEVLVVVSSTHQSSPCNRLNVYACCWLPDWTALTRYSRQHRSAEKLTYVAANVTSQEKGQLIGEDSIFRRNAIRRRGEVRRGGNQETFRQLTRRSIHHHRRFLATQADNCIIGTAANWACAGE